MGHSTDNGLLDSNPNQIFPAASNQKKYIHLKEKYKDRILELNTTNSSALAPLFEEDDFLSDAVDSVVIQGETTTPSIINFETTNVPLHLDSGNSNALNLLTTVTSQLDQTQQGNFSTPTKINYIHLKEKHKDKILKLKFKNSTNLSTITEEDYFLGNTVDSGLLQSETSTSAIANLETTKAPLRLDSGNLDTLNVLPSLTLQLDQTNQEASGSSSKFPSTDSPQQLDWLNQDEIFSHPVLPEEASETTTPPMPENIESQTATEANDDTNSTVNLADLTRLASESGLVNEDGTVSLGALCLGGI